MMTRERDPLLDRIKLKVPASPDAFERLGDRRAARERRRRAAAGAVGLGLSAVIAVGLFAWLSTESRQRDSTVGASVPLVAEPGEYYYVRVSSWSPSDKAEVTTGTLSIGPDGSGRSLFGKSEERFAPGEAPWSFLTELSTDPNVALGQLISRGSPGGESPNPIASSSPGRSQETTSLLRTLQDLLTLGSDVFLLPEQVSAIQRGASELDDVTTETGVIDPLGRVATRLSWVVDYNIGPGSLVLWYFEPASGQMMGEYWVNQRTGEIERATWVDHAGIAASIESESTLAASYVPEGGKPSLGPIKIHSNG